MSPSKSSGQAESSRNSLWELTVQHRVILDEELSKRVDLFGPQKVIHVGKDLAEKRP